MNLRDLLAQLKTVMENGYTLNSRSFAGTGSGQVFSFTDYKGDRATRIITSRKARENEPQLPLMYMNSVRDDYLSGNTVGSKNNTYDIQFILFFNDTHKKTVGADVISGEELAQYMKDELNDALYGMKSQLSNVMSMSPLAGSDNTPQVGDTDIFYAEVRYRFTTS